MVKLINIYGQSWCRDKNFYSCPMWKAVAKAVLWMGKIRREAQEALEMIPSGVCIYL